LPERLERPTLSELDEALTGIRGQRDYGRVALGHRAGERRAKRTLGSPDYRAPCQIDQCEPPAVITGWVSGRYRGLWSEFDRRMVRHMRVWTAGRIAASAVAAAIVASSCSSTQSNRIIEGTLAVCGGPLPGIHPVSGVVVLSSAGLRRETTANSTGRFTFDGLPASNYTVRAEGNPHYRVFVSLGQGATRTITVCQSVAR